MTHGLGHCSVVRKSQLFSKSLAAIAPTTPRLSNVRRRAVFLCGACGSYRRRFCRSPNRSLPIYIHPTWFDEKSGGDVFCCATAGSAAQIRPTKVPPPSFHPLKVTENIVAPPLAVSSAIKLRHFVALRKAAMYAARLTSLAIVIRRSVFLECPAAEGHHKRSLRMAPTQTEGSAVNHRRLIGYQRTGRRRSGTTVDRSTSVQRFDIRNDTLVLSVEQQQ
jgi:hypothetical protein